ncbi:hypothetical protein OAG36_00960, partial [bacterium]|nr:hypothetical protein [bacterium]
GREGGKYTYVLKNSELPSHRHVSNVVGEGARGLNAGATGGNPQVPHQRGFDIGKSSTNSSWTSYTGGGGAFQITMPYRTVRWWVRYA